MAQQDFSRRRRPEDEQNDPRGPRGTMSRGNNVYLGGNAARSGGGPGIGRPPASGGMAGTNTQQDIVGREDPRGLIRQALASRLGPNPPAQGIRGGAPGLGAGNAPNPPYQPLPDTGNRPHDQRYREPPTGEPGPGGEWTQLQGSRKPEFTPGEKQGPQPVGLPPEILAAISRRLGMGGGR